MNTMSSIRAEIIERLKKNLAQFQYMQTDEREVLLTIEKKETQFLNASGSWRPSCRTGDYDPCARYRISADYTEQPHLDGYRLVKIRLNSRGEWVYPDKFNDHSVGDAVTYGAVGFWPKDGKDKTDIVPNFVFWRTFGGARLLTPTKDSVAERCTHVVFEEEQ